MENNERLAADRPISSQAEDRLNRYTFAKRVAETIIQRKASDSIVYGLFGAWGEGKTSLVNLIKAEISKAGDSFVQVTFNPWRFTDEATLLTSFFNSLANAILHSGSGNVMADKKGNILSRFPRTLKNKIWPNKEPLKTTFETIGGLLQNYGKVAAGIPIPGAREIAEATGAFLSDVNLDDLKARVEALLKKHEKRIVIYIDDLDRLDKNEIYFIFRLVKLTGDFAYTTYVLSFDQVMVAAAIGDRFGSGNKEAGEHFLEKIIQVPLNIPKAQPKALQAFCFQLINAAIAGIDISREEMQRFGLQFTTNVLPRLKTPRLAVRYGNSLSFTIPLLLGEVNIVDLMLIQSLHVFYPDHYSFVKSNPEYFLGSTYSFYANETGKSRQDKISLIKQSLEELGQQFTRNEKDRVVALLIDLFPQLGSILRNHHLPADTHQEWYHQKRIASRKYFDRYFSYAVIEGDVSDVEFSAIERLVQNDENAGEAVQSVRELLKKCEPENLLDKFRLKENDYEWPTIKNIIRVLCQVSDLLPKSGGHLTSFETPFGQAAIFIAQRLTHHKNEPDVFDFTKMLMNYCSQFRFAFEIFSWLDSQVQRKENLFNDQQHLELDATLRQRALTEAGNTSIFDAFPDLAPYLANQWAAHGRAEYDQYVRTYLGQAQRNVISLIKVYTPTVSTSLKPEPQTGDLSEDRYNKLVRLNDKDLIYHHVKQLLAGQERKEPHWDEFHVQRDFSEINLLWQYVHWYERAPQDSERPNS